MSDLNIDMLSCDECYHLSDEQDEMCEHCTAMSNYQAKDDYIDLLENSHYQLQAQMNEIQNEEQIYREALEHWGEPSQICQTLEEMAELSKALLKYLRYKEDKDDQMSTILEEEILHELIDVHITTGQMKIRFAPNGRYYTALKKEKLKSLQSLIDNSKKQPGKKPDAPMDVCTL